MALARAIAGLDPITASEIGKLIVDLQEQKHMTSIVWTHDMYAAKKFSDRMVVLNEGVVQYLREAA